MRQLSRPCCSVCHCLQGAGLVLAHLCNERIPVILKRGRDHAHFCHYLPCQQESVARPQSRHGLKSLPDRIRNTRAFCRATTPRLSMAQDPSSRLVPPECPAPGTQLECALCWKSTCRCRLSR